MRHRFYLAHNVCVCRAFIPIAEAKMHLPADIGNSFVNCL
jgi:hypothetical protein